MKDLSFSRLTLRFSLTLEENLATGEESNLRKQFNKKSYHPKFLVVEKLVV